MVISHPQLRGTSRDLSIAVVTDDVYSVMSEHDTLGYVHKVGPVYVALSGDVLSHAVEVGQSLSWDQALRMVRSSAS
ncbi:MAG TPA: hypothetical protein VGP24_10325 [Glaciihabitans sp.]|jgi:hypothetical protein|nr:hypothetical protein [Glaciihabitans sp.]